MNNNDFEQDNDNFLDNELNELNKVIQSANQLVQQLGVSNPFFMLQQQYAELAKQQLQNNSTVKSSETVILRCINRSKNPTPRFQRAGDSGFDLQANLDKPILLKPMEMVAVPTGLYFEIENGYEIQIRSRSGLAMRHQVFVMNQPGTIDSGYRGEIIVLLFNLGKNELQINHGDRIAQGVVCPVIGSGKLTILDVTSLSPSERGTDGFGSTGMR